jgi:hypothetical protein
VEAAAEQYFTQLGIAVGQGGKFDYQRGPGNNVGLFGQQSGWSLDHLLKAAGGYAWVRSSHYSSDQPYGLDPRTREYIELGYKIGESGAFGQATARR